MGIALRSRWIPSGSGNSEITHRLSTNGAWLGKDVNERLTIQKALKQAYNLRSSAAHRGVVTEDAKTRQTFDAAIDLIQRLVREVIDRKY
jgi:Apea-like HEPN